VEGRVEDALFLKENHGFSESKGVALPEPSLVGSCSGLKSFLIASFFSPTLRRAGAEQKGCLAARLSPKGQKKASYVARPKKKPTVRGNLNDREASAVGG